MKFFSPKKKAFYAGEMRCAYESSGTWPADAKDVGDDVYAEFSATPPDGFALGSVSGSPAWVKAIPYVMSHGEVERRRLFAYADPITGSDRYKAEADAERIMGNEEAARAAEQKLISRRNEIQEQYPWP